MTLILDPLVGDNFFGSPLYHTWLDALGIESKSHGRLYKHISERNTDFRRDHYEKFVEMIRAGLQQNEPTIKKVVRWIYLESDLFPCLFTAYFPFAKKTESLPDLVAHWQNLIKMKGFEGCRSTHQDNFIMGNIPLFECEVDLDGFKTKFFRTPQVFTFNDEGKACFTPEYSAMLAALEENKEACFYINSMSLDPKVPAHEGLFSATLHEMEQLLPHLFATTVDRDSEHYETTSLSAMDYHKKIWLNYLFEKTFVRFTSKMEEASWKKRVAVILDFVHLHYFENRDRIPQKKIFHELCYVYILLEQILLLKPNVCHVSCRVSVDRGPSLFALLYVLMQHRKNEAKGTRFYEQLTAFLLGPALVFCNRAIFEARFIPFIDCMHLILSKPYVPLPPSVSEEEVTISTTEASLPVEEDEKITSATLLQKGEEDLSAQGL